MPTPIAITLTLALFAGSLFALRADPGFRAWPLAEKINWAVIVLTVWPWILLGFIPDHRPRWYTATVLIVGAAATLVFLIRTTREIRRTRTELDHLRTTTERFLHDHREPPP